MKPNILVDTSSWIEYFNIPDSKSGEIIENLLHDGRVVTAGIVLTELLQGAKVKEEFEAILENVVALPMLKTTTDTWIEAGRISFALRRKGITIPITDLIIAGLALQNECQILTLDPHFKKIPGVSLYKQN
ncbi:MAG: PIN domain-containing protein [Desulfobacterales bacterium]|jgi:predicted nucleic acid-binding protein|nr:PIN domain-containing protein [Desulfobacterales bacterium]